MTIAAFVTLKFARALRENANLTTEYADGFISALADAIQGELATQADLRQTGLRLKAKIETIESDFVRWGFGAVGF